MATPPMTLPTGHATDDGEISRADLLPFIPDAAMTILEGTGHLSPLEVPRQIARELDSLINRVKERV